MADGDSSFVFIGGGEHGDECEFEIGVCAPEDGADGSPDSSAFEFFLDFSPCRLCSLLNFLTQAGLLAFE